MPVPPLGANTSSIFTSPLVAPAITCAPTQPGLPPEQGHSPSYTLLTHEHKGSCRLAVLAMGPADPMYRLCMHWKLGTPLPQLS